ncbi:MAG: D-2-hydroxyacid dehydrogenase [Halobacteriaceae archaeon]
MSDRLRILVLKDNAHGIPSSEYADDLRERLPGHDVKLAPTKPAERDLIPEADVVTGGYVGEDLLARAENLRLFAASSAGVGHLPLDAFEERGVRVTNASGVHGPNIAEHVLGWLLAFVRRLDEGWRRQRNREWRHFKAFGELKGSTATVVGLGPIGEAVVERLDAFDVHTVGVRYTPEKGGPTDEVVGFEEREFHEALSRTDFLVLACPLTETTEGLIDGAALDTLPPDAVLVNVARGKVVDTDALLSAIRRNDIHAAGLDVTDPEPLPEDHPLWGMENVLVTPHNSGHTPHYWERVADILERNLRRVEETGEWSDLENQVV